jgi:hypothetical protein
MKRLVQKNRHFREWLRGVGALTALLITFSTATALPLPADGKTYTITSADIRALPATSVASKSFLYATAFPPLSGAVVTESVYHDGAGFIDFAFKIVNKSKVIIHSLDVTGFGGLTMSAFYVNAGNTVPATVVRSDVSTDNGDTITWNFNNGSFKGIPALTGFGDTVYVRVAAAGFTDNPLATLSLEDGGAHVKFDPYVPTGASSIPSPEPSTLVLACLAGVPFAIARMRRWRRKDAGQEPLTV